MPAGRAERAVEAPAKSIDGVEHSGMIKGVMAVRQIDDHNPPHSSVARRQRPDRDHRSDLPAESTPIALQIARTDPLPIAAPRPSLSDAQAVV
jgi:hypothetical protein